MSLPNNFPTAELSAANRRKLEWFYRRYVEEFYQEYKFGHFLLAAYAAVPALLTPDLLYKLWQNFHQYQWAGKILRIHRVAVSDLLLSPVCREVGFEMYEMEPLIRKAFLEWQNKLPEDPLWQDRQLAPVKAIAEFLEEYHARPNPARQRWGTAYEEIQEWNTLAFIQPETLQKKMWQKLKQSVAQKRETETLRVLDFWSKSETQLTIDLPEDAQAQWRQNAQFAQAWKALLQNNTQFFTDAIARDPAYQALLDDDPEGGIAVRMPAAVRKEVDRIQEAAKQQSSPEERVWALLIGVEQYTNPDLPRLNGCRNDVTEFQRLLENATDYLGMPLEVMPLIDREANVEQVRSSLNRMIGELQDGDHFVFFFAGNSANSLGRESWEKDGTLYLYDSEPGKSGWFGLRQEEIEDLLFEVLAEKKVNALLVLDHPKSREQPLKKGIAPSFRDAASNLKGSLVILYGAEEGQSIYEGTFGHQFRGVFPYALLDVFWDKGFNISFENLIETTRLRMTQLTDRQTPIMETFPAEMSAAYLFSHEVYTDEKTYEVSFDLNLNRYVINAGARQGITPSLEFMPTLIRLEDGRELAVEEVYRDQSSLSGFTGDSDAESTYSAKLVQTAFPKIQIAFDPGIDEKMEAQLRSVIQSYNIYYIDIRDKIEDAKYFIHSWQNDYFLSRQISSRDANSGTIKPIFNLEPDPFELIKQMEYIAQWSGVVEFQNPRSQINSQDMHIRIGLVEGRRLNRENLNSLEPDRILEEPKVVELSYRPDPSSDQMLQPGIQVQLRSEIKEQLYISVLYLDSNYGIIPNAQNNVVEPGAEISVPFTLGGQTYRTIPLNFDLKYLDLGRSEIYDYLKFIISTAPLNTEPLQQDALELDKEVTRTIISRQEQKKGIFIIGEMDWTAITIPIKINYEQSRDIPESPYQQQQTTSQTRNVPEEEFFRQDYSGSEAPEEPAVNPEELQLARDMVGKGELNRAIELTLKFTKGTALENDLFSLSGRFNALERQNRTGTISFDEYNRSQNRITYSLLEYIRLLEGDQTV